MLSAAPDGCKMEVGSTDATTHFILHKAIATYGVELVSVEIVEKISMTLEVDAPSAEEAILQVIEKYRVEQIVVESNEGTKVDFFVSKVEV